MLTKISELKQDLGEMQKLETPVSWYAEVPYANFTKLSKLGPLTFGPKSCSLTSYSTCSFSGSYKENKFLFL